MSQDWECTMWPDGLWTPCCIQHDYHVLHGMKWSKAARMLRLCVKRKGYPFMAWAMYVGVMGFYYSGARAVTKKIKRIRNDRKNN